MIQNKLLMKYVKETMLKERQEKAEVSYYNPAIPLLDCYPTTEGTSIHKRHLQEGT